MTRAIQHRHRQFRLLLVLCAYAAIATVSPLGRPLTVALAEDSWNPFASDPSARRPAPPGTAVRSTRPPASPPSYRPQQPYGDPRYAPDRSGNSYIPPPRPGTHGMSPALPQVERGQLAPVKSSQSGLPFGVWQGLTADDIEQLAAPLHLPSGSAALQALWLKLLTARDAPAANDQLIARRADALYRSGRLRPASALLARTETSKPDNAVLALLQARTELALFNNTVGCPAAKAAANNKTKLPRSLRGEAIVLAGFCAIAAGSTAAAGLAADLARGERYHRRFTLAILDAIANGRESRSALPETVEATDYLLLKEAGFDQTARLVPRASPALLTVLLADRATPSAARLAAAEEAARRNVIDGPALGDAYRSYRAQTADPGDNSSQTRAALFKAAERNPTPLQRTRIVRRLIDASRRAHVTLPVMRALKPIVDQLRPAPEISWFASTAIEIALAAEDYGAILPWLALAQSSDRVYSRGLQHWRVLADMADPEASPRNTDLTPLVELTARGRFRGPQLLRLTTVLDALDHNVPIAVWDAANQASKVATGKLPPTGVLTQLLEASKARQTARTTLLAMRAINGATAETAHLIALGDAIRGLRRAGLATTARRLAFEAVFASWPRPDGY